MKNKVINLLVFLGIGVSQASLAFPKAEVHCSIQNAAPGTGSLVFDSSQSTMCYENVPGNCTNKLSVVKSFSGSIESQGSPLLFDEFFAVGRLSNGQLGTQWLRIYRNKVPMPTVGFATSHGADFVGSLFPGGAHFHQQRPMNYPQSGDPFCIITPST